MTRTRSVPGSLLDSFATDARERAAASATAVADAQVQYWLVVDKLAGGDASGGIDRASFAAILAALGFNLEQVRTDVAAVQRVRQARLDLEAVMVARDDFATRANAAGAALQQAKKAAEEAEDLFSRTQWARSDADQEASRLRLLIRDELRGEERVLRARGFTGELLAPPPPPKPKRRWRFRNGPDASLYAGRPLQDGSEVDMPAEWGAGGGHDSFGAPRAVCLGSVTPEMGPPVQIPVPIVPVGQRAEDVTTREPVEAGG